VFIDLATDSGTGAMSDEQWAGLMVGDEAYIRSKSFFHLEKVIRDVFHYEHVIPPPGARREQIFMALKVNEGDIVLSNTHFDTTGAHVMNRKAVPVDLVGDELWRFDESSPSRGTLIWPGSRRPWSATTSACPSC